MPRLYRAIPTLIVASGLLASGAVQAAAASPASYRITIGAKSNYPAGPIAGDILVIYRTAHYDAATIAGRVTGFRPGDEVSLLAKPFRATRFKAHSRPVALTTTGRYSFTVQPALATQYKVQVLTSASVDVTSSPKSVYVTPGSKGTYERVGCSGSRCKAVWHLYTQLPASAYGTEVRKHWYLYLADSPMRPKYLPLIKGTASRPRKINSGEYEITLTFPYRRGGQGSRPWTYGCARDTERRDGIGLPRPYHCGDKKIKASSTYLG